MSRRFEAAVEAAHHVADVMRAAGCFEDVEIEPASPSLGEVGVAAWLKARVPRHDHQVVITVFDVDNLDVLKAKLDFDLACMESRTEALSSMGADRN